MFKWMEDTLNMPVAVVILSVSEWRLLQSQMPLAVCTRLEGLLVCLLDGDAK